MTRRIAAVLGVLATVLVLAAGTAGPAAAQPGGERFTYRGLTYAWTQPDRSDLVVTATPGQPDRLPAGVRAPAGVHSPAGVRAAGSRPSPAIGRIPRVASPDLLSTPGCTGVPDSYFGADFFPACDAHDRCYSPDSRTDRLVCDRRLYRALMTACLDTFGRTNPLRYSCLAQARIYYIGVRLLGRWNYDGTGDPR